MDHLSFIAECVKAIAWPVVTGIAVYRYRDVVKDLLSGSEVEIKAFGSTIKKTIPEMKKLFAEILEEDGRIGDEQMDLLKAIQSSGVRPLSPEELSDLRLLRDAGLIRSYPKGKYLADAESTSTTPIGRLVLEARDKKL
jgi:hypothetical protein